MYCPTKFGAKWTIFGRDIAAVLCINLERFFVLAFEMQNDRASFNFPASCWQNPFAVKWWPYFAVLTRIDPDDPGGTPMPT